IMNPIMAITAYERAKVAIFCHQALEVGEDTQSSSAKSRSGVVAVSYIDMRPQQDWRKDEENSTVNYCNHVNMNEKRNCNRLANLLQDLGENIEGPFLSDCL